MIFDKYYNQKGDIIVGIIHRCENRSVFLDMGNTEVCLGPGEQMPGETYSPGMRIRAYIIDVKKTTKGPQIQVSRTHPGFLERLFELEVPEIRDGTIEVKSVAREAGYRSKIAVWSDNDNVDALGACVGPKGARVQAIVNELRGEKIDIIKWNEEPTEFIASALSPAKVISVEILEGEKGAQVIVPDYQLSLAIGKEGQNARLAAKLTGWKIDIKSESQINQLLNAMRESNQHHEDWPDDEWGEEGWDETWGDAESDGEAPYMGEEQYAGDGTYMGEAPYAGDGTYMGEATYEGGEPYAGEAPYMGEELPAEEGLAEWQAQDGEAYGALGDGAGAAQELDGQYDEGLAISEEAAIVEEPTQAPS
jgi:N utilization substance protein A